MKHLFPLFIFILISYTASGGLLKGKVTDNNGKALPFASVYIQGTTIGTSTNEDGVYQLSLQPGTYKVISQYIGYRQSIYNVSITAAETVEHNFILQDQSTVLKEIVVHASAEDPAYPIIRKTIAKRPFHLDQVRSFQTSIYLKGVGRTRQVPNKVLGQKVDQAEMGLDSGKGVIYLCEEVADYYAARPNKRRTIIHSVRESGNPHGLGLAQMPPVITFYENNVPIASPRGFISPISDNALYYYKYKLLGEFQEEGRTIYKIKVTPKRLYEPLFSGTIYIVDGDWAIHSLDMTLSGKSNLDILDTVTVRQLFLPLKKDTWVIKNQVMYFTAGIFGFNITGNFVTVYNNQKVNEPIPDTMFTSNIISQYDKAANKKDSSYWTDNRPIPLEKDEVRDYKVKDSIRIREESPAYRDSMQRVDNKVSLGKILIFGLDQNAKGGKDNFRTNSLLVGIVNYNTVEGLNLAPKMLWTHKIDSFHVLETKAAVRYGFSNTHFNAIGRITYTTNAKGWIGRQWQYGLEGGKYVFQYNPDNPIPAFYNTLSTLLYDQNYLKIYERWNAGLFIKRDYGNGFSWSLTGAYQKRLPLANTTTYTWMGGGAEKLTDNVPDALKGVIWEQHDAAIAKVSLSYKPGVKYVIYPDYKMPTDSRWPRFTLDYEKGLPDVLNSKVDFDKWRFSVRQDLRLRLLGMLSYNVAAGGFLNKNYVSLPDMMHLDGNEVSALPPGFYLTGFELAPYYRYSNIASLYGEAHVEYNLLGLLTNKIPLLRQAHWYAIVGNNTFYMNDGNYYTEAFVGIDNIGIGAVRGFRVDIVQSWDSYNHRNTGIRIGIKPSGFGAGKIKREEW